MHILIKAGLAASFLFSVALGPAHADTPLSDANIAAQCAAESSGTADVGTCSGLVGAKLSGTLTDGDISNLVIALGDAAQQGCAVAPPVSPTTIVGALNQTKGATSNSVLAQQIDELIASLQSCDDVATASITPFGGGPRFGFPGRPGHTGASPASPN